jgi:type IV pilus biogenesis protein CpaD/CtpE
MKTTTFVVALALLAGCAGQDEKETTSKQDITQAVRDFIEVRELDPLDLLR